MSQRRPKRALGQFSADTATTIVGGQPRKRRHQTVTVPVGVERTLFLAATDHEFCRLLFSRRGEALQDPRLMLRPSELAMLHAIDDGRLRGMVDGLDTSKENVGRRRFLHAVAATAAAAALAPGCGDDSGQDAGVDTWIGADAGVRDYWYPHDVRPRDVQLDAPIAQPDAGVPPDFKAPVDVKGPSIDMGILPDMGNDGLLDAAVGTYKDLEWELVSYQGGFNPHTTTWKLKGGALDMETSSLAGGVVKTCKTNLTPSQLATLLLGADKVNWAGVKQDYTGVGCGYPGDSGTLKITLTPTLGAPTMVNTKWCVGAQGFPADLAAFLVVMETVQAAACP